MRAAIKMGKRPEWGGFNMFLLALQIAPEAWWSAYLEALHEDGVSENGRTRTDRRHSDGFMEEE
jgi:hypothetical protein